MSEIFDSNLDGIDDTIAVDTDGAMDTMLSDTDQAGDFDVAYVDTNRGGVFDSAAVDTVADGLEDITANAFTGLPEPHGLLVREAVHASPAMGAVRARRRTLPGESGLVTVAGMASMGVMALRMATMMDPFALLAGAAMAFTVAGRGKRALQQQLTANLTDSLAALRRDNSTAIDGVLDEFRPRLYRALEGQLTRSIDELQKIIASAAADASKRATESDQQDRSISHEPVRRLAGTGRHP